MSSIFFDPTPKDQIINRNVFFPIIFPKNEEPQLLKFENLKDFYFKKEYEKIFKVDNIEYYLAIYFSAFKRGKNSKAVEIVFRIHDNKYKIKMNIKSKTTFVFNATVEKLYIFSNIINSILTF